MQDKGRDPWVVVSPHGVAFLGYAVDEERAWAYATQHFSPRALPTYYKSLGWYAAKATVTWAKPNELFTVPQEGWGTGWQAGPRIVLDEQSLFNQPEVDLFK